MTNDEYRLRKATLEWMVKNSGFYSHAVTLTMKQTRKILTEHGEMIERITKYNATINMKHFIKRFNAASFGNLAKASRGGRSIAILPALERGAASRQLHYHCAIGNLPALMSDNEFDRKVRSAWQQTAFGNEQIYIERIKTNGWLEYMGKEILQLDNDVVDWENVHN